MLNLNSILIGSAEPKELAGFYEKVFQKKPDMDDGGWYGWQVGSSYFSIGEHSEIKGEAKEPQRILLDFETSEVKEEFEHAMRFYHYIIERGEQVQCLVLEAPPSEWSSVVNVFEAVLHHEQDVTKLIHTLVDLALQYKDDATHKFLQWFVAEQREEEFSAGQVLKKTKIAAEDSDAFVLLDQELEKRKI